MASVFLMGALVFLPAEAGASQQEDMTRDRQWYLSYLKVLDAQKISVGEGISVAVVDTGVMANHRDLAGSVMSGTVTASGRSGDGRIDPNGHGTAMAGLIAAHGHGQVDGVLGIAPGAKVLPVQAVLAASDDVSGSDAIATGIDFAVRHGAKIINISLGTDSSTVLQDAVNRALAADVVVVASTGNLPLVGLQVDAPARYPGVLAVGAVDRNGNHAPISMTGPEVVLSAPGVDIVSTDKDGTYRTGTGTSDATAIVSGAVALIRAKYPQLSAKEVIHRLTATATDKGAPGRDEEYGYGVLNLVDALTKDVPPEGTPSATPNPTGTASALPSAPDESGKSPTILILGLSVLGLLLALAIWIVIRRRSATGT